MNRELLGKIARRALCRVETLQATYWLTRMTLDLGVPGDLVECGVFAGAHPAVMAQACIDAGEHRTIHLFDSFRGIPKGGPEDNDIAVLVGRGGGCESSGVSSCPSADVLKHFQEWETLGDFRFHEGWFDETLPAAQIEQIALLRLDADLYHGTKLALEHLYPKLVHGAWCIADDYQLDGCRQAVTEHLGAPAPVYWQKGQK